MLTVGRGRGAGGGVQRIGPALVMPSAARMSLLEHPCDQHFAQARPSIYPTATERFLPWWTGHLIRRLVPVNWAGCVAVLTVTPLVLPVGCYRRAFLVHCFGRFASRRRWSRSVSALHASQGQKKE